ncbi:hypothetical protein GF407_13940 [candidate division KSB1 bacterium]|nr:hypothetical protein [candidate division KSB1 bacterium]
MNPYKKQDRNRTVNSMLYISSCVIFMGAVQGLFFALILLTLQNGRTFSNIILATLLILVSIVFFSSFGLVIFKTISATRIFRLTSLASLCVFPVLFFYVRTLLSKTFSFSAGHLFHGLAVLLLGAVVLIFCTPEYDLSGLLSISSYDHQTALRGLWLLYAGPYLLSIYLMMKSHDMHTKWLFQQNRITDRSLFYLHSVSAWISTLLIAFCAYWFLCAVSLLFPLSVAFDVIIALYAPLMVYVLGFVAIQKPELFFQHNRLIHDGKVETDGKPENAGMENKIK